MKSLRLKVPSHSLVLFSLALLLAISSLCARTLEDTRIKDFQLSFSGPFGHFHAFELASSGGKVLSGRFFDVADGFSTTNLVRYSLDGQLDPSFRSQLVGVPNWFKLSPDGRVFVWRSMSSPSYQLEFSLFLPSYSSRIFSFDPISRPLGNFLSLDSVRGELRKPLPGQFPHQ